MKKYIAIALAIITCVTMFTACTPKEESTNSQAPSTSTTPAQPSTTNNTSAEQKIVVADYLSKEVWEDDGGDVTISDDKILFSNFFAGDFAAVRMKETADDTTWEYTVQVKKRPEGLSEDAGDWWDAEFLTIIRSAVAGGSYLDGEQTGYTITSWGDLGTVYIGRAGYDDAFGYVAWPIGDGQPHVVSFSAKNNESKTVVHLTLAVDGEVIFECDDDGSLVKKERVSLYPDAGGLTIRCKYLEVEIS